MSNYAFLVPRPASFFLKLSKKNTKHTINLGGETSNNMRESQMQEGVGVLLEFIISIVIWVVKLQRFLEFSPRFVGK